MPNPELERMDELDLSQWSTTVLTDVQLALTLHSRMLGGENQSERASDLERLANACGAEVVARYRHACAERARTSPVVVETPNYAMRTALAVMETRYGARDLVYDSLCPRCQAWRIFDNEGKVPAPWRVEAAVELAHGDQS
jgi:hypothetical protein